MSIETIYREESGRILATLIRLLGDFDAAEEAMQDAFAAALEQWPSAGTPGNPRAWLVSTARHKAIDELRRRVRFEEKREEIAASRRSSGKSAGRRLARCPRRSIPDDRLRLIFTCCHPALAPEAQVALTLRTLCGLSTDEIARAFLVPAPTMAQRLVRAKRKIRDARHPLRRVRRRRPARRAARRRAGRHLPDLQRRLRRDGGRRAGAARSVRGGDPPRPPAQRADARSARGARGCWR